MIASTEIIDKVMDDTYQRVKDCGGDRIYKVNIAIETRILEPDEELYAYDELVQTIKKPTIYTFLDLEPMYKWAHLCTYYLYDAHVGELYYEHDAVWPPYLFKATSETFKWFHYMFNPALGLGWDITTE